MHMLILLPVVKPSTLFVLERIVKVLEFVSNPFVFLYTIKYVQFNSPLLVTKCRYPDEITKTEFTRHIRSGTIKIPPCSKILTLKRTEVCPKFHINGSIQKFEACILSCNEIYVCMYANHM